MEITTVTQKLTVLSPIYLDPRIQYIKGSGSWIRIMKEAGMTEEPRYINLSSTTEKMHVTKWAGVRFPSNFAVCFWPLFPEISCVYLPRVTVLRFGFSGFSMRLLRFIAFLAHVHQFKGSSSSIGAQRVKNACVLFRNYCEGNNLEGCVNCLHHVEHEYYLVKNKLETLFRAGTSTGSV